MPPEGERGLCFAYPGVRRIEKKHRVAVLRAIWRGGVFQNTGRVALTMSGTWAISHGGSAAVRQPARRGRLAARLHPCSAA
jgi:hypothetical protein